jgi:hypothetical protein
MRLFIPLTDLATCLFASISAGGSTSNAAISRHGPGLQKAATLPESSLERIAEGPPRARDDSELYDYKSKHGSSDDYKEKKKKKRRKIAELFKKAFKKCGAKLKRAGKSIKEGLDKGLSKLSKAEKKIHRIIAHKLIKGSLKIVGKALKTVYMEFAIVLEPILGMRLVAKMDRFVGGAVILGKSIGRWLVDHMARITGIAVGLLVGAAVTAGLTMLTLNPIVAGAIGGAVGAVSNVLAYHHMDGVIHGNLVPTSTEEAAIRGARLVGEMGVAAGVGFGAGALTGGLAAGFAGAGSSVVQAGGEVAAKAVGGIGRAVVMGKVRSAADKAEDKALEHAAARHSK